MRIERIFRLSFFVFLAALWLAGGGSAQTGVPAEVLRHADMILINGKVVTADKDFSSQEAVAIRDGKILAVGPTPRIRPLAGPRTKVVDLQGRAVIPGLIDSHMHFLRAGFTWAREVRLDQARSVQEVLSLVEKRGKQLKPGEWILTFGGWHYGQLKEGRAPARQELDRVLRRAAVPLALRKLPRASFEEKVQGLKLVIRDFHAAGLTGVIETIGGGVSDDDLQVLFEAWRRNELTIRTALLIYTGSLKDGQRWMRHLPMGFGDDWLRVNGFGERLVAAVQDSIAPAFPLKPEGLEEYRKFAGEAARNRWSIQQHTTLGTTAKAFLDIFEEVDRRHPIRDLRWSLAHVELISEADIRRVKRLGMGLTIQDRQVIGSELMGQAWGDAAASGPPLKKMLEIGVPVGAGTDATVVAPYQPFTTLWWLVSGKNWAGRVVRPNDRISREDALRMHTVGSAWFSFDEKVKGSIEPGKLADLVVLTDDYLTVPEDRIRDIRSVMTIVGGRIVYEAK
ncbi:MAG: amidohydrolase [Candidatus Tectomicrobia bacterium]|nr:amidohydrolase [Candidatus Tectomicrobia bacterium]